jgi:hypothetical protein
MTEKYLKIFNSFISEHPDYTETIEYCYENFYLPLKIENIKDNIISEEVFNISTQVKNNNTVYEIIQNSFNILSIKGKKFNNDSMNDLFIESLNNYKNQLELFIWINMNCSYYITETSKDTFRSWLNNKVVNNIKTHFNTI